MGTTPLISIVTATYNRSNVLRFALESVRWQTYQHWELWVIGDACTDDTAQVVASFHDPRMHFLNLPHNSGEQSRPNNVGGQHAQGQYIAYLNHDDLWLPDHLSTALQALIETGADLVFTLVSAVQRHAPNLLYGEIPLVERQPPIFTPASTWVFRRELLSAIGPWRYYRSCYRIPSQDWLFRAWRARKTLSLVPRLTVVAIPSGKRSGSYANREVEEHHLYAERIRSEPDFRERELATMGFADEYAALRHYRASLWQRPLATVPRYLATCFYIWICWLSPLDPLALYFFLRDAHRGFYKGAFVDHLRRIRGLPPLDHKRVPAVSTDK